MTSGKLNLTDLIITSKLDFYVNHKSHCEGVIRHVNYIFTLCKIYWFMDFNALWRDVTLLPSSPSDDPLHQFRHPLVTGHLQVPTDVLQMLFNEEVVGVNLYLTCTEFFMDSLREGRRRCSLLVMRWSWRWLSLPSITGMAWHPQYYITTTIMCPQNHQLTIACNSFAQSTGCGGVQSEGGGVELSNLFSWLHHHRRHRLPSRKPGDIITE